jgi:putative Holliday junction resolvase
MRRALGLDAGDRTIGVAVSDLLGLTAQGVETIRRTSLENDLKRLQELMAEYETKLLIMGLPKNMNGTEGVRCDFVHQLADEIKAVEPEAEIIFWDERLSTVAAAFSLVETDRADSRNKKNRSNKKTGLKSGERWIPSIGKKRRENIDTIAAVFILQNWLDSGALKQ